MRRRGNGEGTLFKRNGRGSWLARWSGHDGRRCEKSTRTTDAAAAQRILNKLVADTALRREGVIDPQAEATAQQARRPIGEHLADFRRSLVAQGITDQQVKLVYSRANRVVEGCGFQSFGDVTAFRVMEYIHGLRADAIRSDPETGEVKKGKPGISAQTVNFYIQAIKQFCKWMVKDRRASESPITHLAGLNVKTDRRHDRQAHSADDLRRLVDSAHNGPDRRGRVNPDTGRVNWQMTGPERAMLYQLAMATGLRSSELRSLTPISFDLDASPPTVAIAAGYSKRRRHDILDAKPRDGRVPEAIPGKQGTWRPAV